MLDNRPAELLQNLIRFDTTNPPGNERPCVEYIQGLLQAAGIETQILARHPDRPNLLARLKGRGAAPRRPYSYTDTSTWSAPPIRPGPTRRSRARSPAGSSGDGAPWT